MLSPQSVMVWYRVLCLFWSSGFSEVQVAESYCLSVTTKNFIIRIWIYCCLAKFQLMMLNKTTKLIIILSEMSFLIFFLIIIGKLKKQLNAVADINHISLGKCPVWNILPIFVFVATTAVQLYEEVMNSSYCLLYHCHDSDAKYCNTIITLSPTTKSTVNTAIYRDSYITSCFLLLMEKLI